MGPPFMPLDRMKLKQEYCRKRALYGQLAEEVTHILMESLAEAKIQITSISYRIKTFASFYDKVTRLRLTEKPFESVNDVAGVGIICHQKDLEKIREIIFVRFYVIGAYDESNSPEDSELRESWSSFHSIVRLSPKNLGSKNSKIRGLKCEIQVKTIFAAAWDAILHESYYRKANGFHPQMLQKLCQEPELRRSYAQELDEYETVINSYRGMIARSASEPEFQEFFEKYPIFLDPRVTNTFPQKRFAGENIPDFVLVLNDEAYVVVELENPGFKLYTGKGNPTAELSHSEEQVRAYLKWAKEEKDFLRRRGLENLNVENTTGLVIIGAGLSADEKTKLENHNAMVRAHYVIKTFDKVLEETEAMLENLLKLSTIEKTK